MNPAFLLGIAFNIAYWHKKYHSGTICKGVSNPHTSWKIEWQGILKDKMDKIVRQRHRAGTDRKISKY